MIKWENVSRMLSKDLCSQNQGRPPGSVWHGPLSPLSPYTSPPISVHKLQPDPLSFPELQTQPILTLPFAFCLDSFSLCFCIADSLPTFRFQKFFSREVLSLIALLRRAPFPWLFTWNPISFGLLHTEFATVCNSYPHATNMSAVCVLKPNGCARQVKTLPVWSNIEHFWQRLLSWSITYFLFFKKCGHISQLSSWQHDHVAEHLANGLGWQWPLPSQARPKKTFQLQFSVLSLILGELDAEGLGAIRYN